MSSAPITSTKPPKPATSKSSAVKMLEKLGLRSNVDLCLHLPLRYEDETSITAIADAHDGQTVQIEGVVIDASVQFRPRKMLLVVLQDASGQITLRFFNFFASQQKTLALGATIRARGEVRGGYYGLELSHPNFNACEVGAPLKTQLTPVYPATAGINQAYLRKAIAGALQRTAMADTVPAALLPSPTLPSLRDALHLLHNPGSDVSLAELQERVHPAWVRLKFEELVAQQLSHTRAKRARALQRAPVLALAGQIEGALVAELRNALPFTLTGAQQRCVSDVMQDIASGQPMHRLLQGDVGSGKTVVAALAAAQCIASGYQCALMAPTELLAEQHFRKLIQWLEPLSISIAWLTGSLKTKAKRAAQEAAADGSARLIVGTHAVITEHVQFARLGLIVVDEQHRFGVNQRLALRQKGVDLMPHQLMMSATPIPRTLAMTYFADLDVSVIDELPPGRTPITTKVLAASKRAAVIERVAHQARDGTQVYWVVPLVEESEKLDLQNAQAVHAELSLALPDLTVVLLHGRLPATEKQATMQLFASGAASVMVATTVIEVGIDVPNASLMVIEHAERFGLSQLHQLRGRVGRGAAASACVLLYSGQLGETSRARLKAMRDTNDGFVIAQRDLEIRGPGELLGARQSGTPLLRFADLQADDWLIPAARFAAQTMLDKHPELAAQHLQRWLGAREEFLNA